METSNPTDPAGAQKRLRLTYLLPPLELATLTLALVALVAILQPAVPASAAQAGKPPGAVITRTVNLATDDIRNIYIYEPTGYVSTVSTPLVIALHGGGGSGRFMLENNADIWEAAERENFLVVYPDGQATDPRHPNEHYWENHEVNAPYINQEVIDYMLANYPVDAQRIYLVGFSGGAQFIYFLAADPATSRRIAGIGTVAGAIGYGPDCPSVLVADPHLGGGEPLPAFMIQGGQDPRQPAKGGIDREGVFNLSFPDKVDIWANHIGGELSPAPVVPQAPATTIRQLYVNSATNDAVLSLIDPGLAHEWPDDWVLTGNGEGAMGAFWEFFQHYSTTGVESRTLQIASDPPGCTLPSSSITFTMSYSNPSSMQQIAATGVFTLPNQAVFLSAVILDPGSLITSTMAVQDNVVTWVATIPPGGRIQIEGQVQSPACPTTEPRRLTATAGVQEVTTGDQQDTHFVRVDCRRRLHVPMVLPGT